MSAWTADELAAIDATDELRIAARRADGTLRRPVTVWVVRYGDDLYVRSARGRDGAWFRAVDASHEAQVTADGVNRDVTCTDEPGPAMNDEIDTAFHAKYGGRYPAEFVVPMVAAEARAATLRLVPADQE